MDNCQLPRRKQVLVSIYVHRVGIHSEQPRISMCFGEWLAITWDDVDFEKETLTIKHSLSKREVDGKLVVVDDEHLKADEVAREIPLTDKALHILKELYLINGQKKYVFNSKGNLPISTNRVNEHIKMYCKATHAQRRGAIQEAYSMQMVEDQIRVTAGHP